MVPFPQQRKGEKDATYKSRLDHVCPKHKGWMSFVEKKSKNGAFIHRCRCGQEFKYNSSFTTASVKGHIVAKNNKHFKVMDAQRNSHGVFFSGVSNFKIKVTKKKDYDAEVARENAEAERKKREDDEARAAR